MRALKKGSSQNYRTSNGLFFLTDFWEKCVSYWEWDKLLGQNFKTYLIIQTNFKSLPACIYKQTYLYLQIKREDLPSGAEHLK